MKTEEKQLDVEKEYKETIERFTTEKQEKEVKEPEKNQKEN